MGNYFYNIFFVYFMRINSKTSSSMLRRISTSPGNLCTWLELLLAVEAPLKEEKDPGLTLSSPRKTERNALTSANSLIDQSARLRCQLLDTLEKRHPTPKKLDTSTTTSAMVAGMPTSTITKLLLTTAQSWR